MAEIRQATGIMAKAYAVARGEQKLTEFSPSVQRRVKHVIDAYGEQQLKDQAGCVGAPPVKVGSRLSTPRKVWSR